MSYSQSGRVIDQLIDGTDARPGAGNNNFAYDLAGRLTQAWVPGHTLSYGFDPAGGCGSAQAAGKNTNRTSLVDNGAVTGYCYDAADKLASTTDARYGTPVYDGHANTATLANQTLTYDRADRHMATTLSDTPVPGVSTALRYVRDATDRIVSRAEGALVPLPIGVRSGYSGPGDSPDYTVGAEALITERHIGLIGGASITKRPAGADRVELSQHPRRRGGHRQRRRRQAGPHPHLRPLRPGPGRHPGQLGRQLRLRLAGPTTRGLEHAGGAATIEMGARQYVPGLGRFLEVDPVEGGCANDYTYVHGDPINSFDLTGEVQSCDNAQDFTGDSGAGLGTIRGIGGGYYEFTAQLFPDFVAESLPPGAVVVNVGGRLHVNGTASTYNISRGKPFERGPAQVFHTKRQIFGPKQEGGWRERGRFDRKRHRFKRGDRITWSVTFWIVGPGGYSAEVRGGISCVF